MFAKGLARYIASIFTLVCGLFCKRLMLNKTGQYVAYFPLSHSLRNHVGQRQYLAKK